MADALLIEYLIQLNWDFFVSSLRGLRNLVGPSKERTRTSAKQTHSEKAEWKMAAES